MRLDPPWIRLLAAAAGALAVAMGAFAAHGVHDEHVRELLRTGAGYALVHAAAALAIEGRSRWSALSFAVGALAFSISLYALAWGAPPAVGAVTPLGGVLMILGWVLAGSSALSSRDRPQP
jgi:uncharacterized membrane protein YgdD (TMEM256/DUF423 family)